MKFECDKCHAQYMIADEKLGKKGVKVKCKKCQHVIIVRPGTATADVEAKSPVAAAAKNDDAASPTEAAPPGFDATVDQTGSDSAHPKDDGFANGGPTDPVARAMMQEDDGPSVPEPPPAPAPISMFGDQTQLNAAQQAQTEQAAQQNEKTVVAPVPDLGPSNPSEEAAPPRSARADATVLSREPEMTAEPRAPAAPEPPAESGNELDDQIAGMFNQMFDESQARVEEEQRGPTRVLDASAVDALRKQAQQKTEMGGMALDSGPDPRQLEAGLVMKGADDAPKGADDGPADAVWHAAIDDQDVGPLALGELGRHIESGRVDRDTLVWKIGMDDWLPAGDVPEVRALFDKVPMPRIGRGDEPARSSAKPSSFDMGAPIDDAPPPPSGGSPFDEASDPAWRPHGLTDVYQAANLAEAAAGMGMAASGPVSAPLKMSAPSASSEPEWRPGAASALSALVQDEMKRLDQPPPPADDGAVLPADDASINAPLFGSLATTPEVDSAADLPQPTPRGRPSSPSFAAASMDAPPLDAPSYAQPSFAQPSFASQAPQQTSTAKNPLVIAGIGVGAVVTLLLLVLVVATLMKDDDGGATVVIGPDGKQMVMVKGPDGKLIALPTTDTAKPADAAPAKPDAAAPANGAQTAPTPGTPADGAAGQAAAGADPAVDAKPADTKPEDAKPADAKPEDDRVARADDKPADRRASTQRREEPKPTPKPPAEKPAPTSSGGKKCDPVLDFDCKAGGGAAAKPPPSDLKESLSKTDVLGVIKAGVPAIENCGKKNKVSGTLKMTWKVQTNGKTSDVQVADSKFAGTPVGSCAAGVIKGWRFPAHQKASPPVTFPFKLP